MRLAMLVAGVSALAFAHQSPPGWTPHVSVPDATGYTFGIDSAIAHGGRRSGYVRFVSLEPLGWATLMQTFRADEFRGQRVRLSAFVKTEYVDRGAFLWMRVEGLGDSVLASANTADRVIRGETDWQRYDVVLEVPNRASAMAIGVLLEGWGRVWVDDVTVGRVGADVTPSTPPANPRLRGRATPVSAVEPRPINLDFER